MFHMERRSRNTLIFIIIVICGFYKQSLKQKTHLNTAAHVMLYQQIYESFFSYIWLGKEEAEVLQWNPLFWKS